MPRSFLHGAYEEESECRIRTDGCFCGGVLMSLLFCCGLTLSASYGSPVAADEAVWIGPQYNDDLERVSDDWFSRVEPPLILMASFAINTLIGIHMYYLPRIQRARESKTVKVR